MLYSLIITAPNNTTKRDAVEQGIALAHGIITKVGVFPRPGHAALAHCAVYHHEHQIFPSRDDEDFSGDTFPIEWGEYYEMYQSPYDLLVRCWNEDDTYPHSFYIYFVVLPRKAIVALAIGDALAKLSPLGFVRRIFTGGS